MWFRKKVSPAPVIYPLTPHEAAMAEEKKTQDIMREKEAALREASGKTVPDDLEGFLREAQKTREARIIAIEKRKTAEQKTKAIQAEALAQRNKAIEESRQAEAEAKAKDLERFSTTIGLREGVSIIEAFLDPRTGLSGAEINALSPKEQQDMHRAVAFKDPELIRALLKKFRNYEPERLRQILPEEKDREILRGITDSPSVYPFWDIS